MSPIRPLSHLSQVAHSKSARVWARRPAPGRLRRLGPAWLAALILTLGGTASLSVLAGTASATEWTTNHHDNTRDGVDTTLGNASAPSTSWSSPRLDGAVYAEPLINDNVVYVATENNSVYALNSSNGSVRWSKHLSTPVTSGLPCGDINPLGITSTPVIDTSLGPNGEIFVVAEQDTGPASDPVQHWLYGLDLATGNVVTSEKVDPAAMDPRPQQQRAALALDDGYVLVGFGGLAGDCPDFDGTPYHGWVVAASETSPTAPLVTYEVGVSEGLDPTTGATQGAIWGPGGPAVDSSGNVYVATGNGGTADTGEAGTGFDFGDAVIKLTPPTEGLQDTDNSDFFAPSNWKKDNDDDGDLGSTNPILIPNPSGGDLVFEVGKEDTAYLLNSDDLGGITSDVVQMNGCFARGAGAYLAPYVYLPCDNQSMVALKVTTGASPSLSAGWTAPNGVNGSPILAGGRVWVLDRYNGTLYGLNPATGAEETTLSLANPTAENFSSAAAGDGILVAPSGTSSSTSEVQAWSFPSSSSGVYTPVSPKRICDTRVGPGTAANQCNHDGRSPGTLGPGGTLSFAAPGVPADATAVVLNVTVTDTTAPSYLTVWPQSVARPTASNLNWSAGQTKANMTQVALGNGTDDVFNAQGSADVVVDLEGYFAPPSGSGTGLFDAVAPSRICDTRAESSDVPANQCNHNGSSPETLGPGGTLTLKVDGNGGIPPSGVAAAVLNVTVTNTTAASYLTAWPTGEPRPLASDLNWSPGDTLPNRITAQVSSSGEVSLFNAAGDVDVVVDVGGWYTDNSNPSAPGLEFTPVNPARICDTRAAPGITATPCNDDDTVAAPLGPGTKRSVQVAGQSATPSSAQAAVLNVTVVDTTASSYLTMWPDATSRPLASDLNWAAGQVVPNLAVVKLGTDGDVDVFNDLGSTDLVVDAEGYYS